MLIDEYQDFTATTEIYSETAETFLDEAYKRIEYAAHGRDLSVPATKTAQTDTLKHILAAMYCAGKLNGEAGEVAEAVFKAFCGGGFSDEIAEKIKKELGDILWYVARLSDLFGYKLSEVIETNVAKLQDRKDRGVIHGYGDDR